jgi:hypothetical protein
MARINHAVAVNKTTINIQIRNTKGRPFNQMRRLLYFDDSIFINILNCSVPIADVGDLRFQQSHFSIYKLKILKLESPILQGNMVKNAKYKSQKTETLAKQ